MIRRLILVVLVAFVGAMLLEVVGPVLIPVGLILGAVIIAVMMDTDRLQSHTR